MKHVTDAEYCDLGMKTARQWSKERMLPNEGTGIELWSNPFHNRVFVYYRPDEVHYATEEELNAFLEPIRAKRRAYQRARRKEAKKLYDTQLDERYADGVRDTKEKYERVIDAMHQEIKQTIYPIMMGLMADADEPCRNLTNKIVFDVETTGLNDDSDEILQISIIDGAGNILISTYVKPYYMNSWEDAMKTHGISQDMVKSAPYAHELASKVRQIFNSASEWIGYNGTFDLGFLSYWGIEKSDDITLIDVMQDFAPFYGEWSSYYQDYKWKSLECCARFFGLEFKAHDSLEDTKATLHCYNELNKLHDSGEYQSRVDENNGLFNV